MSKYHTNRDSHLLSLSGPYGFPATNVRFIENIPYMFQAWMAHLAREQLRLGVFFRAAAIMAQVPGASTYEAITYNNHDDDVPDYEYCPLDRLINVEPDIIYSILAECLERLKVGHLIDEVPTTASRYRQLPVEWIQYLNAQEDYEHAYQNVIAECLNMLIVKPGMTELNDQAQSTWWQECWAEETKTK